MTYASVSVSFGGMTLTGYMLDNGRFQFLMNGVMQEFDSLLAVCQAWADTH